MKPSFLFCFVLVALTAFTNAQTAKDYAVPLQAAITENPATISLKWPADTVGTGYSVYRKQGETNDWGTAIATLPISATSWTDTTVTVGIAYEYYVQRQYADPKRLAHGYIQAAIKKKISNQKNTILLLVDETYSLPLGNELIDLMYDLLSDGWIVDRLYIPHSASPAVVKNIIHAVYDSTLAKAPLTTLFIIGHVAVPYSGGFVAKEGNIYPPDGHPDHGGAWATDMYYGSLDDGIWTDNLVNDTTPARAQNKNIPGDGKFDLMYVGDHKITLETGRIDFTDMPAFSLNDTELTRQYLNKLHAYKNGETPVHRAGLIDDNIGVLEGEVFSPSAWNDFTTFFGDSVSTGDYVTEGRTHPYLFTYGCGFGNYSTCFGVVNTNQFANDSIQQIFTLLFGSYFGDWDSQNNLLKAALATKSGGLASAWSGRPYWHLQHMALGGTIGYSARLTQNNYFTNTSEPSGYVNNSYPTAVNINLMGDPTLRLHMRAPMQRFAATTSSDSMNITLKWPAMPGVTGYEISKTTSLYDGFPAKLEIPATDTTWTDLHPYFGYTIYMIRPIYLEQTPSGSYYNMGLGYMAMAKSINTVGVQEINTNTRQQFRIYPNPSSGTIVIEAEESAVDIEVYDIYGRSLITERNLATNQPINLSILLKGSYFITIKTAGNTSTQKLFIN
jgi:hypothetical protein